MHRPTSPRNEENRRAPQDLSRDDIAFSRGQGGFNVLPYDLKLFLREIVKRFIQWNLPRFELIVFCILG